MVDRRRRTAQIQQIEELIASLAMATSPVAGPERWLELDLTMAQVKTLMVVRYHGFIRIGQVARDLSDADEAVVAHDHERLYLRHRQVELEPPLGPGDGRCRHCEGGDELLDLLDLSGSAASVNHDPILARGSG